MTSSPTITPAASAAPAAQLLTDLADYEAANPAVTRIDVVGTTKGTHSVVATVDVPTRLDLDQDENLWETFVQHRVALGRLGFRLTMPVFERLSFAATVERVLEEIG